MTARRKNNTRSPLKYIAGLVLVAAWIVASAFLQLPPASWLQESSDNAPQAAEAESPTPAFPDKPPFRFGSRTLSDVCSKYGIAEASITRELAGFAITAKSEWSIKRIAEENDMEREALFEVIRELSLNP